MNHWRRAGAVMGVAVFLVALTGGLLAAAVGGGSPAVAMTASTSSGGSGSSSGSAQLPAAVKAQAER
jgi:hypothetical protein